MGIVADVFVSSPEDANNYSALSTSGKELPSDRFQRVRHEDFTPLEYGSLWAILEGRSWDVGEHQLEHVGTIEDGENWLERFPQKLVELLAAMSDQKLSETAKAWGQTEELDYDEQRLVPILHDLRKLAQAAIEKRQSMHLWGSFLGE